MKSIRQWFDNGEADLSVAELGNADTGVDWLRVIPFLIMHLACLAVIFVGISSIAVAVAVALYLIRMFAITAFYHRYFSSCRSVGRSSFPQTGFFLEPYGLVSFRKTLSS